jgi:Holliday junction resolvase
MHITDSQGRANVGRGRRGEAQIKRLLIRAGWRSGYQPGSGASGARSCTQSRQGDLWASCGSARMRIEVKHYKNEPRTLASLRAGSDVLAYICRSTGKVGLFIDEALFVDLLAWSAEALEADA